MTILLSASQPPRGPATYERALAGARHLGYEFYVSAVKISAPEPNIPLGVSVRVENNGVAPFYYDWPLQLGVADSSKQVVASWDVPWQLPQIVLPGDSAARYAEWSDSHAGLSDLPVGTYCLLLCVVNPLPNGKPLSFANPLQDIDRKGWLTLGTFTIQHRYELT